MPVPVNYYDTQGTPGGESTGTDNTMREAAPYFAAAAFASDLLGAFYGSSQYRNELKIQKEQKAMNKILADSQFNQNMQALFNAQQDLKDKTTLELEAGRKEFKARQASIAVAASERGQEGQSISDVHNDLTRTHEAYKQLQLLEMSRGERDLMLRRQGIIDQRSAQTLGDSVGTSAGMSPFLSSLSSVPTAGIQAILDYRYYRGDSGADIPDFKNRGKN